MTLDPMIRTELTGPWAGFGFQQGHLWTPEGHSIEPEHMVWMSLTANIAREWRLMMAEARSPAPRTRPAGNVVYLRDVLRERREQQERFSSERMTAARAAQALPSAVAPDETRAEASP